MAKKSPRGPYTGPVSDKSPKPIPAAMRRGAGADQKQTAPAGEKMYGTGSYGSEDARPSHLPGKK